MEALFGGLGIGGLGGSAPRSSNLWCNSIEDLQQQLQTLVATRSNETRADHISITLEVRANAALDIPEDGDELAGEDGNGTQQRQRPLRTVMVSDTIQNQPSDDPALQRAVAKHVVGSLGMVDNSTWNVRQVSRAAQGWTFTYHCKHSLQAWNRQNAKTKDRPVIGAFSGNGGLDSVNLSRPAFDCRGTLTVAFSKTSRAIMVKYEHTPLHKTVGELVDRLPPVRVPPILPPANLGGMNRSTKAKRPPPQEGEGSATKKRKNKGTATADGDNEEAIAQGAVQDSPAVPVPEGVHATSIPHIPEAEAARRREVAINLLTSRNIDPASLSPDQFSIFANQAPQLQEASLQMLEKYGAERLRIVHPGGDKEQSSSTSSTPTQQNSPVDTGTADTPTKKRKPLKWKLGLTANESPKETTVSPVAEDNTSSADNQSVPAVPAEQKSRRKKSRAMCTNCKQLQRKCTKEFPQCSFCAEDGQTCMYLPPKPRRKSQKSSELVEAEESEAGDDVDQSQMDRGQENSAPSELQETAPTHTLPEAFPPHQENSENTLAPPVDDPDNDEFIPDPNILSGPLDQHSAQQQSSTTYYHTNPPTVAYPAPKPQPIGGQNPSVPAIRFPQMQYQHTTSQATPGITQPTQEVSTLSYAEPETTLHQSQSKQPTMQHSQRGDRDRVHSAKDSQAQGRSIPNAAQGQPVSTWNSVHSYSASPGHTHSQALNTSQHATERPTSRTSGAGFGDHVFDGLDAAATLSQVASQHRRQSSAVAKSPYQKPAQLSSSRSKSRQGQRSRNQTPVTQTPVPPPQIPTAQQTVSSVSPNVPPATTSSNSAPLYDPYGRYNTATPDQYSHQNDEPSATRAQYDLQSYSQTPAGPPNSYTGPSYDFPQGSSANLAAGQTMHKTSGYGATNTGGTNQWPARQSRPAQPPSRGVTNQNNPTNAARSSSQGYGGRGGQRQSGAHNAVYNQASTQQSQQPYRGFASQQTGASHEQDQVWYGFNQTNSNSSNAAYSGDSRSGAYNTPSGPASTNYSQARSNIPGYHGYGQEGDLYELLRTGGSGH